MAANPYGDMQGAFCPSQGKGGFGSNEVANLYGGKGGFGGKEAANPYGDMEAYVLGQGEPTTPSGKRGRGKGSRRRSSSPQPRAGGRLIATPNSNGGGRANPGADHATAGGMVGGEPLVPIAHLGPYIQHWRIRARVVDKTGIREYKNARGPGKLFSAELADGQGGKVRVTFFNAAVDKFFGVLALHGIYDFSGGQVKAANPRWSPHPVELTFDERSAVVPVQDDGSIPKAVLNFVRLADLQQQAPNSVVDVIAVAAEIQEAKTIQTKKMDNRRMRKVTLRDDSGASCSLTLWGERADMDIPSGAVICLSRVRVGDFGGRSLDMGESGAADVNPDNDRSFALHRWFQERGHEPATVKLSSGGSRAGRRQTLQECRQEDASLALAGGPDASARTLHNHRLAVTVMSFPHERPPFYQACTTEVPGNDGKLPRACNRRVQQGFCSANHACENPIPRYVLRAQVADHTGGAFVSMFDDQAAPILGLPACDLYQVWERMNEGDVAAGQMYEHVYTSATHTRWELQVRSKREEWEGKERVKMVVVQGTPINYVAEGREMLGDIRVALGLQ